MKVLKVLFLLLILIIVGISIAVLLFQKSIQPQVTTDRKDIQTFTASRFLDTPIVHPTMHPRLVKEAKEYGYTNINGPSLIRVPNWVDQPLGQYYL